MSPLTDRRSSPAQSRSVVGCWLLFLLLLHACPGGNSGGPVYVNGADPQAAQQQSVGSPRPSDFLTQTVYGFLDFTTTIGNTVMVFSPQTVPPDGGNKPTKPTSVVSSSATVIETKPSARSTNAEIKPSKTVTGTENKDTAQKKAPSIKVNVVEGKSSVVEVKSASNVVLSSKVEVVAGPASVAEKKSPHVAVLSSRVDVVGPSKIIPAAPQVFSSVVEIHSSDEEPTVLLGNNIGDPEYDFLSRQPSEFVEETYKVVNLKPSSKFHLKPRASLDAKTRVNAPSSHHKPGSSGHPTGLVTKLGGTVVKDGATTVHETSVIGTYISGKYAQVLQSTSHIFQNPGGKPKPTPASSSSSSLRILKTAAPVLGKSHNKHAHHGHLDPTPAGTLHEETAALPLEALFSSVQSSNLIRPSRRPSILSASGGGGAAAANFKNRFRNRVNAPRELGDARDQDIGDESEQEQEIVPPQPHANSYKKSPKLRPTQSRPSHKSTVTFTNNKFGRTSGVEIATVSVFSEHRSPAASSSSSSSSPTGRRHYKSSSRRSAAAHHTTAAAAEPSYTRRGYKPRLQTSSVESAAAGGAAGSAGASTSLYKFKLNRQPGRWQYKTTPKPRVTIRKQNDADDDPTQSQLDTSTQSNSGGYLHHDAASPISNDVAAPQARSDESGDLELSGSSAAGLANYDDENTTDNKIDQPLPMETIKIEISTPADFKDVYYEIATIKSPYTFQVGSVKNTRYITVTSTIEKNLIEATESPSSIGASEPLTENILATASHYSEKENNNNNVFEMSVATLPPIILASDVATPPLETLTETFSTTQEMLKTHILPVFRDGDNSTMYTLVQTYRVTRLVTATKTLPPMEAYHFVPSKTLNEFNSRLDEAGTELHLELEFGDDNDNDGDNDAENTPKRIVLSDLDLAKIGSDFDLSDVDKTKFPDAHLRLKKAPGPSTTPKPREDVPSPPPTPALSPEQLQQLALLRFLNPAAQVPQQVVTTSKPVVRLETVYESHVIPIIAGASTSFSTISRPIATLTKTEYELGTSTIAIVPPVNQLFAQQQQQQQLQQFAVTSTPVVAQTVVTQTDSKVLKLTFGAKTAYTTLYSTRVVPTLLTTYMTASVPVVQPTAFPGYFPAPYAPFPYVG